MSVKYVYLAINLDRNKGWGWLTEIGLYDADGFGNVRCGGAHASTGQGNPFIITIISPTPKIAKSILSYCFLNNVLCCDSFYLFAVNYTLLVSPSTELQIYQFWNTYVSYVFNNKYTTEVLTIKYNGRT